MTAPASTKRWLLLLLPLAIPSLAVVVLLFGHDPVEFRAAQPLIHRSDDFVGSDTCRSCHPDHHACEMWTLAHAHGNLLGILCVAFAAVAKRTIPDETARASIARWLRWGAVMMPLGFFLGGVLNHEGDPSWAIALVPLGGLFLLVALVRTALSAWRS